MRGRPRVLSAGGHRTAMFKIRSLMVQEEIDDASPKPRRSIEFFCTVASQFLAPIPSLLGVHLPPMRLPNDRRQIARNPGRLFAVERVYFDLEILRQQLTHKHWFAHHLHRPYAAAEIGRKIRSPGHNPAGIIPRHRADGMRRPGLDRLFEIQKAMSGDDPIYVRSEGEQHI
jgi:hypothetical protein